MLFIKKFQICQGSCCPAFILYWCLENFAMWSTHKSSYTSNYVIVSCQKGWVSLPCKQWPTPTRKLKLVARTLVLVHHSPALIFVLPSFLLPCVHPTTLTTPASLAATIAALHTHPIWNDRGDGERWWSNAGMVVVAVGLCICTNRGCGLGLKFWNWATTIRFWHAKWNTRGWWLKEVVGLFMLLVLIHTP